MKIYCLKDYKGNFLSRYDSEVYRSGMDKAALKEYFQEIGVEIEFLFFSEVQNFDASFWMGQYVLYTSSEDHNLSYKSYIEDIVYYLELNGARLIPEFRYLKANNNKVFMELLIKSIVPQTRQILKNKIFGCYEEVQSQFEDLQYPVVFKKAAGAMSKGVGVSSDKTELSSSIKQISGTKNFILDLKDRLRAIKHPGYQLESKYRNKFILQDFVPGLDGDFKVLIFGTKYYVLKRGLKKDDFRASGSGIKVFERELPDGLLEYASEIFKKVNLPIISMDIAFNGSDFFLIEFQAVHFGTYTLMRSDHYWLEKENGFELVNSKSNLEEEYASSIANFIKS
ncbi:hypothetical protein ML462_02235 [Gramella lutea]|uniref:ATP-grasp domain-containing protein n=1 Tax=Christiangramia lutea TaxID=1607951 RepID=A0A9X2A7Y9_9FLAO|nr:hypothetical protein [Christiangramia lutea]MCH4821979.1 hypothetical protein [Christiangramia lutea]